jgi:hypothetical protein
MSKISYLSAGAEKIFLVPVVLNFSLIAVVVRAGEGSMF